MGENCVECDFFETSYTLWKTICTFVITVCASEETYLYVTIHLFSLFYYFASDRLLCCSVAGVSRPLVLMHIWSILDAAQSFGNGEKGDLIEKSEDRSGIRMQRGQHVRYMLLPNSDPFYTFAQKLNLQFPKVGRCTICNPSSQFKQTCASTLGKLWW